MLVCAACVLRAISEDLKKWGAVHAASIGMRDRKPVRQTAANATFFANATLD